MNRDTFTRQFGRMAKWFGKKPTDEQLEAWYDRVQEIQDSVFPTIVDGIIDTEKYMPTPQDVRNLYESWLAGHPQARDDVLRTWCPDCNGTGCLRVQLHDRRGATRETWYRCRACRNWDGTLGTWVPLAFRSDLEERPDVTVLTRPEREDGEGYLDGEVAVEVDESNNGTKWRVTI